MASKEELKTTTNKTVVVFVFIQILPPKVLRVASTHKTHRGLNVTGSSLISTPTTSPN